MRCAAGQPEAGSWAKGVSPAGMPGCLVPRGCGFSCLWKKQLNLEVSRAKFSFTHSNLDLRGGGRADLPGVQTPSQHSHLCVLPPELPFLSLEPGTQREFQEKGRFGWGWPWHTQPTDECRRATPTPGQ